MEKKSISFNVQMTEKEVYRYTLYHVYHSMAGFLGLFLAMLAILNLLFNFHEMTDQMKTVMFIIALWSTVIDPAMMKTRCKAQFKRTKAYQQPLKYCLDEKGITVSQNDTSQSIEWGRLIKAVESKTQFLLYSSRVHAFIFPKSMLDGREDDVRKRIAQYTKDTSVKLKGKLKNAR